MKYDLNETIDESLSTEYLIQNEWFHLYIILYPVILNYVFLQTLLTLDFQKSKNLKIKLW